MLKSDNTQSQSIELMHRLFGRTLVDLGKDADHRLKGIYSPVYDKQEVERFMSNYYESIEGVQSQVAKIDLTGYYFALLSEAFAKIDFLKGKDSRLSILELGCGFGSATFPLLKLLPNADVIASEFSVSMLLALKSKLDEEKMAQRCALLQLNAEDLDFKPNSFDLITGAAILHHLFRPEEVIKQSLRILKPRGVAIFFEPFENGYSILGLIYKSILNDKRAKWLGRKKIEYFRYCIRVWQKMKTLDKTDSFFLGQDDKWFFTRQYISNLAEEFGYDKCLIYKLEKSKHPFETLAKTHLEGNNIRNIPGWIWDIVKEYEEWFSDNLKEDLLTEGCIILKK